MSPIRLLYLPNEPTLGWQAGPRALFECLLQTGVLDAYFAYSFEYEWRVQKRSPESVMEDLLSLASEIQPTHFLWQHPKDFPITAGFFKSIRTLQSPPTIIYDERDPHGPTKPLPRGGRILAQHADICYTTGLGTCQGELLKAGAKRVEYCPTLVDTIQFGQARGPEPARCSVLMIANIHKTARFKRARRYLTRFVDGNLRRLQLGQALRQRFGPEFELYGTGWPPSVGSKGPLPYEDQEKACQGARVTVSWDQFESEPYYFSDRLPIALISGVPHVCHYHPGYEDIFPIGDFLLWGMTVAEVISKTEYLLSRDDMDLHGRGIRGAEFVRSNLTYDVAFGRVLGFGFGHPSHSRGDTQSSN